MAEREWTRQFQAKAEDLRRGDNWQMEFDEKIVPNSPEPGWKQYIRKTSAWFTCSCGRGWPSNKVMVIFHMHLNNGMGAVKVRRLRQSCKRCGAAPMMMPDIGDENLDILLEKLVEQIRIKCYNEDMGERNRPFVELEVRSPHEPAHCEACRLGICDQ